MAISDGPVVPSDEELRWLLIEMFGELLRLGMPQPEHLADELMPVVRRYADQRAAEVIKRDEPWAKAQALDDAADALLDGEADGYVALDADDGEALFRWLTDWSGAIRAGLSAAREATT